MIASKKQPILAMLMPAKRHLEKKIGKDLVIKFVDICQFLIIINTMALGFLFQA